MAPHKPTLYLKLSIKNQVLHTVAYTLYGDGDHAPPAGGVREPTADVGLHTGKGLRIPPPSVKWSTVSGLRSRCGRRSCVAAPDAARP